MSKIITKNFKVNETDYIRPQTNLKEVYPE